MHLFIADIQENIAVLQIDETQHCKRVLRLQVGDELLVTNGQGLLCKGTIASFAGDLTYISIIEKCTELTPVPYVHLVVAPTKNIDRFEFLLEKVTELNVNEITPIYTQHSERKILRLDRCEKIITAAIKQCHIPFLPKLNPPIDFINFIPNPNSTLYIGYCGVEYDKTMLHDKLQEEKPHHITIFIGPEGDFTSQEVQKIVDYAGSVVSLAQSRLRTETAGIMAIATTRIV